MSGTGPNCRTAARAISLPMYGSPPPPLPSRAAPSAMSSIALLSSILMLQLSLLPDGVRDFVRFLDQQSVEQQIQQDRGNDAVHRGDAPGNEVRDNGGDQPSRKAGPVDARNGRPALLPSSPLDPVVCDHDARQRTDARGQNREERDEMV